jgi:hypothetical protein
MRAHGYDRLCARYRNQRTFLRTIKFEGHAAIGPLKMLRRDTPILPDDGIQIIGGDGFWAFSIRDALRQMGEEGEGESRKGVPCPNPKVTSSPLGSCGALATFVIH